MSIMSIQSTLSDHAMKTMKTVDWFLEPQFYLVGCLYVVGRIFNNLSQTYVTFYVQYTLALSQEMIALVPMIMFVSGFATSMILSWAIEKLGYKITFVGSCTAAIGNQFYTSWIIYFLVL